MIALCRKPVDDDLLNESSDQHKDQEEQLENGGGFIEYTRHNMNQYYQVEEVLSLVDIGKQGNPQSQNNGMTDHHI